MFLISHKNNLVINTSNSQFGGIWKDEIIKIEGKYGKKILCHNYYDCESMIDDHFKFQSFFVNFNNKDYFLGDFEIGIGNKMISEIRMLIEKKSTFDIEEYNAILEDKILGDKLNTISIKNYEKEIRQTLPFMFFRENDNYPLHSSMITPSQYNELKKKIGQKCEFYHPDDGELQEYYLSNLHIAHDCNYQEYVIGFDEISEPFYENELKEFVWDNYFDYCCNTNFEDYYENKLLTT